jgi:hypothetical protein
MLRIETKNDLQRLIDDEVQESLTLDYKASPALAKDNRSRDELCKDVTAFANSAGGQIVYGIKEENRKPTGIDQGSDLTREWIEQVIDSKVQPRLESLVVKPIPVGDGRHAYVITIGQAATRAPHQAPDKKYYKRQNFQSVPMEDYEIRDTFRRASTPELHVNLAFGTGPMATIEFETGSDLSKPIVVIATVTNRSPQPAFHAILSVGVDTSLPLRMSNSFYQMGMTADDGEPKYWLGHRMTSPPLMPIFKEVDPSAGGHRPSFSVAVPSGLLRGEHIFYLATSIQTPGYSATERWIILSRASKLQMCAPGHPFNR